MTGYDSKDPEEQNRLVYEESVMLLALGKTEECIHKIKRAQLSRGDMYSDRLLLLLRDAIVIRARKQSQLEQTIETERRN